jgi:hypothetical protein
MRRDEQRLRDILAALGSVTKMVGGHTETEFLAKETCVMPFAQRFTLVGEAVARLSDEIKQRIRRFHGPILLDSGTSSCTSSSNLLAARLAGGNRSHSAVS